MIPNSFCDAVAGSGCGRDVAHAHAEAAGTVSIAELVARDGLATELAVAVRGQRLRVVGYPAPSLLFGSASFLLTEGIQAPCLLCGSIHGHGAEILVALTGGSVLGRPSLYEPVEVVGRLVVERPPSAPESGAGRIRLVDAVMRRCDPDTGITSRNREWREEIRRRPQRPRRIPVRRAPDFDPSAIAGTADLILTNGRIHTLSGAAATVEAVAVRDGRFIAVGDSASVGAHAGPGTEIINLGGRTAVPGLIDSHIHQIYVAFNVPAVDLLGARSIADVQRLIGERAATTPKGEWVIASSGWHESLLAEGRMPTRWELDQVSPDHPVIIPRGGHVVTVNTRALERAGITDETPDPSGGVIVRDKDTGEATGVLLETAAYFARRVAPLLPEPDEMDRLLEQAMRDLNRYGIVGVVDPVVDETTLSAYTRVRDAGRMTVRTDLLFKAASKADTERGIAVMRRQEGDDMLRFPGIKFMIDGGVEGARMREPYRVVPGEQPDPEYRGLLIMPPGGEEEFVESLKLVAEAGLQAQTHGVGDEAIDVIVRSYEAVNDEVAIGDLRWCLMHAFLPSDEAIRAIAEMGVLVTVQDHPVLLGHNQKRWWGDDRAGCAIPVRRLIDGGLLVGGGSDGPVVPVDPFLSMWWMVTRQTLLGYALGPEQAITAQEALELYTINNARILGVEDRRGSIEPGKLADMAVLSQDILAVDPDEIRNTRALLTMVDGKIVHRDGL